MAVQRVDYGAVEIIGNSPAILRVKKLLVKIAQRDAPVLIEGETGTGKEVVARALHYTSQRVTGPFIPVNCGAIPDGLLESELFGHCQGAFTDAKKGSPGIFLLAHGGTLFLDEVDALSAKAQVALLRFLQEHTIRPIGGTREQKVDVRVVAASNRNLNKLISDGAFRQDLFYRLNVLYVELPHLRDRGHDIRLFADYFLVQMSQRYGGAVPTLDIESCAWLMAQRWRGNVRELENLLEREFLLHDGQSALRLSILDERAERDPDATSRDRDEWNYRRAKARVLERFDRAFLANLMRCSRGNVALAARTSGKERRDLGRLLRKYDITPDAFRAETQQLESKRS